MALTSSTPIELSDIQNEFDATSLVGASNAAGLSLPTGMLEFLGLSSSVTLTVAPAVIIGSADFVDAEGWDGLNLLENRLSFSTAVFANTPSVLAQAREVTSFFTQSSAGWEAIPTNATVNFIQFFAITAGCCSAGTTSMATLHFWHTDTDNVGGGSDETHLGGAGSLGFLSVSNNFFPITSGASATPGDLTFASTRPKVGNNANFITAWNRGEFGFKFSGSSTSSFDYIVKRNSDPSVELRIHRILAEVNYSL